MKNNRTSPPSSPSSPKDPITPETIGRVIAGMLISLAVYWSYSPEHFPRIEHSVPASQQVMPLYR